MKKILLILLCNIFILCSPIKSTVRDDFKSSSEETKDIFLKKANANSSEKSVLILTKGYKGEKIIAQQGNNVVYSGYPISNLKNHLAGYFSFENDKILIIVDNFAKQEIKIEPKKAKKHKFIYLNKSYEKGVAKYQLTFSNTLRSLD